MHLGLVGAGAMGSFIAREIARSAPESTLTVIDAELDRAAAVAGKLAVAAVAAKACDARDVDSLSTALRGCAVVVNAAQYDVNPEVMRACLASKAHYVDLGGMFHTTRRQLELADDFRLAGLTAVLGMGAAPGMTNVLARHAVDQLDAVETIAASFAAAAPAAPPLGDVFVPPYSVRTLMQEFCDESMQYLDGGLRVLPALAGRQTVWMPAS